MAAKPIAPSLHDPQPDARLDVVGRRLELAVAEADDLGSDALHAYLSVLAPETRRLLQGGIGNRPGERRVETVGRHQRILCVDGMRPTLTRRLGGRSGQIGRRVQALGNEVSLRHHAAQHVDDGAHRCGGERATSHGDPDPAPRDAV